MVDAFGTLVALMLSLAALVFTVFDRAANVYTGYSLLKKQYTWQMQVAITHNDELERTKCEELLRFLDAEHWPEARGAIIIHAITILTLLIIICVIGSNLGFFAQLSQTNEKPTSTCQNVTYVVNNYFTNYTLEQKIIKIENHPFSVAELKNLMHSGTGTPNR